MTTEFRIDKPGVYKTRNDRRVYVWPLLLTREWWSGEDGNSSACAASELYRSNGRLLPKRDSEYDIVEYISPLPSDILQRMAEALALAEESPRKPDQREKHACNVCGNVPDEDGIIEHGRGCYVVNEDGGGITLVDFDEEPK